MVALGEFQMMHSRFASLVTSFWPIYPANTLVVTGTIVTCVCYVGVVGGLKENRCMLISVSNILCFTFHLFSALISVSGSNSGCMTALELDSNWTRTGFKLG